LIAILLHTSVSWWNLFTVSAIEAEAPVLVVVLLKWLLAAAVAVSWLRRTDRASDEMQQAADASR
jgi:hypothetical protein